MKAIIAALMFSTATVLAQRLDWKPTDFEPLTDLPWKRPDATLETVIEAIFREPNPAIRYPVLAEYLRIMPAGSSAKRSISAFISRGRKRRMSS